MRSTTKLALRFVCCIALGSQLLHASRASAVPLEPPKEVVQNEISTRQIFGLDVDPDRVRATLTDPAKYRAQLRPDLYDLTLTSDEADRVKEQVRVHQAALSLADILVAETPETFAGGRVGPGADARGAVTIYVAGATQPTESRAAATLGKGMSYRVIQVKHSQAELVKLASALKETLVASAVDGTTGVDDDRNAVVVTVAEKSEALPPEVDSAVADGLAVVDRVPGTLQPAGVYKNQPIAYQLVEGGQHLSLTAAKSTQDISGIDCTSGFAVANSVGTYLLTAGHCLGSTGSNNCTGWSSTEIW
jgi:hypothetical protein